MNTTKPRMAGRASERDVAKSGSCQTVYWVQAKQEKPSYLGLGPTSIKSKYDICASYQGDWLNNQKHGYGIQVWPNGNKYEGNWEQGKRWGHGTLWIPTPTSTSTTTTPSTKPSTGTSSTTTTTSSGDKSARDKSTKKDSSNLRKVYVGDWENDRRHGLGVGYYPDGSRYEGEWVEGKRQGRGTLYYANGDCYVGEWLADEQTGFGSLTRHNGDVYEGEWINSKREGQGIYYYRSKEKVYDGEWVADQPKTGIIVPSHDFFTADDNIFDDLAFSTSIEHKMNTEDKTIETTTNTYIPNVLQLSLDAPLVNSLDRRKIFKMRYRQVPKLKLIESDFILGTEIAKVREERQAARTIEIIDYVALLGESVIQSIKQTYDRYDVVLKKKKETTQKYTSTSSKLTKDPSSSSSSSTLQSYMNISDIPNLLADLGYLTNAYDIYCFTRDANISEENLASARVTLQDIIKIVYLCDSACSLKMKRIEKETQEQNNNVDFQFFFNK